MQICVLLPTLDAFKGGNHLPLLAAASDVSFTIVTSRMKPADAVLPKNVRVITLGKPIGHYYYGTADRRFAKAVLALYPPDHAFWSAFDVIHCNQTLHPSVLVLKKNCPVLYAVHHPVTVDREVAIAESGWLMGLLWRARYAALVRGQQALVNGASHVMTVSQTVMDRLAKDYGMDRERVTVVSNGVDGELFHPVDDERQFDVIAMGSLLHPRKGFRYLCDLYRLLSAHGLRIADVGRRSLAQEKAMRGIPGVTIFGTIDDNMLRATLQKSRILVSCSLYEGFGLSLIEALSCGTSVVAFDCGAVGEVLRPIDADALIDARDIGRMAECIRTFIAQGDSALRERGVHLRERVLALYPLSKAGKDLAALYENLTAGL